LALQKEVCAPTAHRTSGGVLEPRREEHTPAHHRRSGNTRPTTEQMLLGWLLLLRGLLSLKGFSGLRGCVGFPLRSVADGARANALGREVSEHVGNLWSPYSTRTIINVSTTMRQGVTARGVTGGGGEPGRATRSGGPRGATSRPPRPRRREAQAPSPNPLPRHNDYRSSSWVSAPLVEVDIIWLAELYCEHLMDFIWKKAPSLPPSLLQ